MDLHKHLVERETELERKRTTALARQMWGDTIDYEARIAECKRIRKWIAENTAMQEIFEFRINTETDGRIRVDLNTQLPPGDYTKPIKFVRV